MASNVLTDDVEETELLTEDPKLKPDESPATVAVQETCAGAGLEPLVFIDEGTATATSEYDSITKEVLSNSAFVIDANTAVSRKLRCLLQKALSSIDRKKGFRDSDKMMVYIEKLVDDYVVYSFEITHLLKQLLKAGSRPLSDDNCHLFRMNFHIILADIRSMFLFLEDIKDRYQSERTRLCQLEEAFGNEAPTNLSCLVMSLKHGIYGMVLIMEMLQKFDAMGTTIYENFKEKFMDVHTSDI